MTQCHFFKKLISIPFRHFKNELNKVIFSSTAAVYGNPIKNRVIESDELNPLNPYAESKLMLENYLINKSNNTDVIN